MTRLLRPLFLTAAQPLLSTPPPPMTLPGSAPSMNSPAAPYPPAPPCSLLDITDPVGVVGLPSCLIPTSPPQRLQSQVVCSNGSPHASLSHLETIKKDGTGAGQHDIPLGPTNGYGQVAPDRLASRATSPSLSFSMSISSSRSQSPCQGPHPSCPTSCTQGLLFPISSQDIPPPSQDNPPPPHSHCSAPASLSNSPGDPRLRDGPSLASSSSTPILQTLPCSSPSCPHPSPLLLCSLRDGQGSMGFPWHRQTSSCAQAASGTEQPQLELEMQEWDAGGKSSTEHISFIDEEGPPL